MNFYFKFKGLMWKYACVQASNLDKARRIVEKYRDDGIYINAKNPVITFEEYAQQKFERIEISEHPQMVWAVGNFADGTQYEIHVRKQDQKENILTFLRHSNLQNANKYQFTNAQVYELVAGQFSLTVKPDNNLVEYLSINTNLPEEVIKKQVKSHKGPFPLFVFKIKENVKEKLQLTEQHAH